MKRFITAIWILFQCTIAFAQNVGIGTITPGFPLNFATTTGDKISLYGNSGSHYGFGIQAGLLQIHSDAAGANISFGYGSSGNFTERMRIVNSGLEGMTLDGRLTIRNGQPSNAGGGGGVWLTKPDNTALLGFMGTQNSQNIGFYGGPGGWGFTYDAINSRVGIGNNSPNVPLAFAPSLGKKITLYPGATGDAGFGMAGNRLQIYADNPNADVAIGYDVAGVFNEKFAVKPGGALAVSGNTGNAGQILMSNGNSGAASWSNKPSVFHFFQTESVHIAGTATEAVIPGLNEQQFAISQTSRVVFTTNLYLAPNAFGSPETETFVEIRNASLQTVGYADYSFQFHDFPGQSISFTGITEPLQPGTYSIFVKILRRNTLDGELYVWKDGHCSCRGGQLIMQVYPE